MSAGCIKNEKELKKLTIDDCLSCSGCIDSSSLTIFTPLINISYYWIISPVCISNIYDYLNISNISKKTFDKNLFLFLRKKKQKVIKSNKFQKIHLEASFNEMRFNRKLISSYCPGIVSYVEKTYTGLLDNLNTIKGAELLAFDYIANHSSSVYSYTSRENEALLGKNHLKEYNTPEDWNTEKIISVVSCFDKKIEDEKLESITVIQFLNYLKDLGFVDFIKHHIHQEEDRSKPVLDTFNYIEYFIEKIPEVFTITQLKEQVIEYKSLNYIFLRVSGHKNILNTLKTFETCGVKYDFTELWVCDFGCYNGPGNLIFPSEFVSGRFPHIDAFGNALRSEDQIEEFSEEINEFKQNILATNYRRQFNKYKMKKYTFSVEW
ncbi:Cytosolic Fe-S cluster assembly factor NAR1 [Cucumispora dikerogammari]|nr:Cytosolic Fe-S cluster assembly factor NAR1 [Cucumispora dikerogammari]